MIGKEAVKDFFEDLQEHYYDYLRLRKSLAELKAEKAKLSARDATNLINMIESFMKNSTESDQKHIENNTSRKEDILNENNYVAPSQMAHVSKIEEDCLYDISYKEQVMADSESNNQGEKQEALKYAPNFVIDPSSSFQIKDVRPNPTTSENRRYPSPNPKRGSLQSHTRPKPPSSPKRYRRLTKARFSLNCDGVTTTKLKQNGQGAPNQRVKPYTSPSILRPGATLNEPADSLEQYESNSRPPFTEISKPRPCT